MREGSWHVPSSVPLALKVHKPNPLQTLYITGLARLSQPLICWQQHTGKGCYQSLLSKRSCQMISSTTC